MESESNSESSDQEIHQKEDDAYAEDDLPDLVLDTHNHRNNSNSNSSLDENNQDYDSTSSSVIDLLLSLTRRRSVSSSDIDHWIDAGEDEIDNFDGEEVRAERMMNDDFKVTYTNHSKAYVPKVSKTEVYRSYLTLMPDEEEEGGGETSTTKSETDTDDTKKAQIHEERLKILAHFQTLSGQEQTQQRETWSQELKILEKEIAELKMQLSAHINRRNHLRLMLGLQMIKKVAKKSMDHLAKEVRDLIKNAKGEQQLQNQSQEKDLLPTSIENNNAKLD